MNHPEASLTEAPDPYEAPTDPEARQAYRIGSLGEATWAMRKLRDLARVRHAIATTAQAEIDRVTRWADEQDRALVHDAQFFEAILIDYALRKRAEDERRNKTLSTPYGEVKTTTSTPWEIDDAEVLEWARTARPQLVRVKRSEELVRADLKRLPVEDGKVIDPTTGEVIPGVQVGAAQVTAKVKLEVDRG